MPRGQSTGEGSGISFFRTGQTKWKERKNRKKERKTKERKKKKTKAKYVGKAPTQPVFISWQKKIRG